MAYNEKIIQIVIHEQTLCALTDAGRILANEKGRWSEIIQPKLLKYVVIDGKIVTVDD